MYLQYPSLFYFQYSSVTSGRVQSDHSKRHRVRIDSAKDNAKDVESSEFPSKKKLGPWRPLKRLTRYEMNHMRSLKEIQPEEWSYTKLSRRFGVSSSAVKRILRSKFDPSAEVEEKQDKRAQQQRLNRREKLLNRAHNSKLQHSK